MGNKVWAAFGFSILMAFTAGSCSYYREVVSTERILNKLERNTRMTTGSVTGVGIKGGATFTGQLNDGRYHGAGILTLADGTVVHGHFNNGELVKGEAFFGSGTYYNGGFKNNEFSGTGFTRSPQGDFYKGGFSEGRPSGSGLQYVETSKTYFEGVFKNGSMEGEAFSRTLTTGESKVHSFDAKGQDRMDEAMKDKAKEAYQNYRDELVKKASDALENLQKQKATMDEKSASGVQFQQSDIDNAIHKCTCASDSDVGALYGYEKKGYNNEYWDRAFRRCPSLKNETMTYISYHRDRRIPVPFFNLRFFPARGNEGLVRSLGLTVEQYNRVKGFSSCFIGYGEGYEPLRIGHERWRSECMNRGHKSLDIGFVAGCVEAYLRLIGSLDNVESQYQSVLKEAVLKERELQRTKEHFEMNRKALTEEMLVKERERVARAKADFEKRQKEFDEFCRKNPRACGCNTRPCNKNDGPGQCACEM